MAETLSFDTGIKEYDINGSVVVRFNPTDANFTDRLYQAFNDLKDRQEEFENRVAEIEDDGEELFKYAHERDEEMRGIIDTVFDHEGLADALFENMNCYALDNEGSPVWIGLFMAVVNVVDAAMRNKCNANDPRLREYDKKHAELLKKYREATTKR